MKCYLATIQNELLNYAETWMNLTYILLSERRHSKKATFYIFPFAWHSENRKTIEMAKGSVRQ